MTMHFSVCVNWFYLTSQNGVHPFQKCGQCLNDKNLCASEFGSSLKCSENMSNYISSLKQLHLKIANL